MRCRRALAAAALAAVTCDAYDGLRIKYWNTTAFTRGDLTFELISLTPSVNFNGGGWTN